MGKPKIGLQLTPFARIARKISRELSARSLTWGMRGVELAGESGLSPGEMKALMQECGLEIAGSHSPIEEIRDNLDKIIEFNKAIGNKRVVCPYLPDAFQEKGREGYQEAACMLYGAAQKLKEVGMNLSYHNHSFEFVPDGDAFLLDTLLAQTADAGMLAEIDTYWVQHGGEDPVSYIRRYSGRIEILHIKDMAEGPDQAFAEIGAGILDWDSIFAAAEKAGVAWYIVEQDVCPGPPIESAKKSFDYLSSRGML